MFTADILSQQLAQHAPAARLCVAYSGGLDSHVLLHALSQLRAQQPTRQIRAIHINHGLSPHAERWAQHCQRVCQSLNIPLIIRTIDPQVYAAGNIEATARHYRYQIFTEIIVSGECLLTAHHREDQAETVLLRLFRGAGPQGLSAMAWQRRLGDGLLVRPLLDISRADLQAYAQREHLSWIEDESNADHTMDRNYLRHLVLPLLQARWPSATTSLSRTAKHCTQTKLLLAEIAAEDSLRVQGSIDKTLCVAALKKLSLARQKNILRFWLSQLGFSLPSTKNLQQILQACIDAKESAQPLVTWNGVEIRRFCGDLYALPPQLLHDPTRIILWDRQAPILLENIGWVAAQFQEAGIEGTGLYLPKNARISIRFRQGGEIFHPHGRIGSHPLKKLYQEWKVPPWMRDKIPLIYVEEVLAMVVGFATAEKFSQSSTSQKKMPHSMSFVKKFFAAFLISFFLFSVTALADNATLSFSKSSGYSIHIENKNYPCSVGKTGIRANKVEGDWATPAGNFFIRPTIFYRADKLTAAEIKQLEKIKGQGFTLQKLTQDDGWVDDVGSPHYNQFVKISTLKNNEHHEQLWRDDDVYDVIAVVGYNDEPVVKGRGSAVFMHVARIDSTGKYGATAGCIALSKSDLLAVLSALTPQMKIYIAALF